jgi:ABC-2 type transport system ATP-binding protein
LSVSRAEDHVIEALGLTKRYGSKLAVDDVTFTVQPGMVTGFLGPNGAGKSTTMRLILGLDLPTSGRATINGRPLSEHSRPLREVGALLEARAVHTGRSARDHLRAIAATESISAERVEEVIDLAGLTDVANQRAGKFSLGMGQRLGIASALLGDPQTLILDEPVNGLDPDGVRWIRHLLRRLADQGRTVFLSSHLMSEMALTADHIVILGRGKLLRDMPMRELIDASARRVVRVRSPQAARLADVVRGPDVAVRVLGEHTLEVDGVTTDTVGLAAAQANIPLLELTQLEASLEEAYMALTEGSVEFGAAQRHRLVAEVAETGGGGRS